MYMHITTARDAQDLCQRSTQIASCGVDLLVTISKCLYSSVSGRDVSCWSTDSRRGVVMGQ